MACVLVLTAVVPTAVLATAAIVAQSRALTDRLAADLDELADAQLGRLELVGRGVEQQLAQIASRTALRDLVAELDVGNGAARTDIARILDDAQRASGDLRAITLFDTEGRQIHTTGGDPVPSDALPEPAVPGEVASTVVRDADGAARMLAGMLLERGGVVVGLVVVEPDLAILADLVEGLAADGPVTTCLYHRTSEGGAGVIDVSATGHKVSACGAGADDAGPHDAGTTWRIPAEATGVPAIVAVNGVSTLMADTVDAQGTRVVAATRYDEQLDWGLTVRVPRDTLLAPVGDLARTMVAATLAIVAVAGLVAVGASRRLTRPIAALRDAAILARDGTPMPVDVRAPGELGELAEAFDTMAESVRRHEAGLRQRFADLQLLTHAMAHDLKAPLGTIHGFFTSLAHGRVTDPGQREEVLERGAAAAVRMQRLVDDLVALIRAIDAPLHRTSVDLEALVDDLIDELDAHSSIERGPMPPVAADAVLLRQVLHNLLDNALIYHAPGTPVQVRIGGRRDPDGSVVVWVDDAGIGIPPHEREDVQEPFVRGVAVVGRWPSGTGLGLSIVERSVERHDGAFQLASSPLGGTRAEVRLPAADVSHP